MIFDVLYCSHFTLGNPKKSFFNSNIYKYFRLFTLRYLRTKQTVTPLPTAPEKNVTALLCKMHNFVI